MSKLTNRFETPKKLPKVPIQESVAKYAPNLISTEQTLGEYTRRQFSCRSQDDISGNVQLGICDYTFALSDLANAEAIRLDQLIFPHSVYNVETIGAGNLAYDFSLNITNPTDGVTTRVNIVLPSAYVDQDALQNEIPAIMSVQILAAIPTLPIDANGDDITFAIPADGFTYIEKMAIMSNNATTINFTVLAPLPVPGIQIDPITGYPLSFPGMYLKFPFSSPATAPTTNNISGVFPVNLAGVISFNVICNQLAINIPYSFQPIGKLRGFMDQIPLTVEFGEIEVFTGNLTNQGNYQPLHQNQGFDSINIVLQDPDRNPPTALMNNGFPVKFIFSILQKNV